MKNILPPPTLPVLPSDGVVRSHSAITATLENTMLDTATEEWLTNMGVDFGLKRPQIFFHDDDLWRAVIKVLAFEHRHTREAVRSVFELILKPMKSQATVLDRIFYRGIATGDLLVITSGPNAAGSPYTVTGVTAHELIFASGTFGTIPDAGPITYSVGTGPAPLVGPTSGINGTIYLAADGTHRFSDPSVKFLNTHKTDFLTKTNQMFPQYGTVIFDKNSPISETDTMAFYDRLQSGMLKLKTTNTKYTHPKYIPARGTTLSASVSPGSLTLSLTDATNFPANAAPVTAIVPGVDSLVILSGPNAGTYPITAATTRTLTVTGVLAITGANAFNRFKITPIASPLGSKGTVFARGGVITSGASSTFTSPEVDFTATVDPSSTTNHGYSVIINRGEINEEIIQVESLSGSTITLTPDPADPSNQTSLLKLPHKRGESVELENLSYSANSTYFISSGTATGGTVSTVVDATNPFLATLITSADIEILTGAAAGDVRTIVAPFAAGTATVSPNFSAAVGVGDTYRVIKRYISGTDNILYLDDTGGFPASNFTVIVDRGKANEEVLYIGTNNITSTPNALTILNSDSGTAFCAQNHTSSFTVEAAQVLVEGCGWEIIETQATGEYTLHTEPGCVPDIDLDSFFLHDNVDLTKIVGGVPTTTVPAVAILAGDTEFTVTLTNYAAALENPGDKGGILCRSLKFGSGATEEEVFATKQKYFTTLTSNPLTGATTFTVEDASIFEGLTLPTNITISRTNSHPSSTSESVSLTNIDFATNTFTTAALANNHYSGDPIEVDATVVLITDVFQYAHGLAAPINLLYLDTIYRHEDPYNPGTYTDLPEGDLIKAPPNKSYLPITPTQEKKSTFPGSYVYHIGDADYPIVDQISQIRTKLATGPSADDLTAAYKIPLTQEIIGSKLGAGLITLGQDISPATTEILIPDGTLFPDAIQNPFYIVLDHGAGNEEVLNCSGIAASPVAGYPNAYRLIIDVTQVINFPHVARKVFPAIQTDPPGTVDLQVRKIAVDNPAGFDLSGGIFIDYGFTHNGKVLYPIEIASAATGGAASSITDTAQSFTTYYASGANALVGAFIILRYNIPASAEVREISLVPAADTLDVSAPWTVAPIAGNLYKIYGFIEVDDSEAGTDLTHVGGVINDVGGSIIVHPMREGGITQEYVTFSSRTGNVVTLTQPTVFKKAHPSETQVILGSSTVGPKTDGSSYAPYLYSNYLSALLNKYVGDFESFIKAVGINVKIEESDA